MAFKKGDPKPPGSGIKKGQKKTETLMLKEMALGALSAVGGQKYLEIQAIENPTAFLTFISKFVPKDVNVGGQPENPIQSVHKVILEAMSDDSKG